ncbi:MAG: hypothetical protein GOMPHAMPRED_004551 [Gomphillus americanus]|uniref:Uncharacterized protein n=1 Tax=Gomphillus americanus TaxID=1940652 RepID=A0A8H3FUA8_9LECA|nr:MAG: hypothetical protein GOMPHAMPRED_004551 [Gomphillus americanus]
MDQAQIETITLEAYNCSPLFDDTGATGGNSSIANVTSTISGNLPATVMPTSTLTGSDAASTIIVASASSSSSSPSSGTSSSTAAGTSTTSSAAPSTTTVAASDTAATMAMTGISWLLAVGVMVLVQCM